MPVIDLSSSVSETLRKIDYGDRAVVCCSGGVDSIVLAFLIKDLVHDLHVVIVDHRLRPNSLDEALLTRDYLEQNGFRKVVILAWEHDEIKSGIEEKARDARYELIGKYCNKYNIRWAFLAHHLDDQIETFLMRLCRGSGIVGLACMNKTMVRDGITFVRPLLHNTKAQIIEYAKSNNLLWTEDETNADTKFTRNHIRDILSKIDDKGALVQNISCTISAIKNDVEILELHTKNLFDLYCKKYDNYVIIFEEAQNLQKLINPEIYRLFSYICKQIVPNWEARGYQISEAIDKLTIKNGFTLGGVKVSSKRGAIYFEKEFV